MKKYSIYRGIDNEIEFKGLRGRYFYHAAGGAVGFIMTTLLLHIVGVRSYSILNPSSLSSGWQPFTTSLTYCYPLFNRYMDKTADLKAEKAKQLSKPTKHVFMVLLPIPVFIAIGIMGNI